MNVLPSSTREPLWRVAVIIAGVVTAAQLLVTPLMDLAVAFGVVLTNDQRGAIEAVVRGLVSVAAALGVAQSAHGSVTPKDYPTLAQGTSVNVANSEDKVIIAKSPPGPIGVEGGDAPADPTRLTGPTTGGLG